MVDAPKGQIPGIYHRQVGDMTVSVISDGYLMGALSVLQNIEEADAQKMIVDAFGPEDGRKTAVNTFLIYSQGKLALVDTGCGIPEVYQRSIFQPFFRVDKSRSREYGGAGLGLSLVWEIADLHGGSVWVEKSSEKGTTIAVGLPTQQSTKP